MLGGARRGVSLPHGLATEVVPTSETARDEIPSAAETKSPPSTGNTLQYQLRASHRGRNRSPRGEFIINLFEPGEYARETTTVCPRYPRTPTGMLLQPHG